MIADIERLLKAGKRVIAEASFGYNDNFCSVDLLLNDGDGVDIVEVKSSTDVKDIYFYDMAFQQYVLNACGLNVKSVSLMYINSNYVRQGELDVRQMFTIKDCTEPCTELQDYVEKYIDFLNNYIEQKDEPQDDISENCMSPYLCEYWEYCSRYLPNPSVINIHGMTTKKKFDLYRAGIVSYEDIFEKKPNMSKKQYKQVETYVKDAPAAINKEIIKEFLGTLSYPLYYLDFETYQQAIPEYDGVSAFSCIHLSLDMVF